MVSKEQLQAQFNEIALCEIMMLDYENFNYDKAELTDNQNKGIVINTQKLKIVIKPGQYGYVSMFFEKYLLICKEKHSYVNAVHPGLYRFDQASRTHVLVHDRHLLNDANYWLMLSVFNFNYWEWLQYSLTLWCDNQHEAQDNAVLLKQNGIIAKTLQEHEHWFWISTVLNEGESKLMVTPNFEKNVVFSLPMVSGMEKCATDDNANRLLADAKHFNAKSLEWAQHYLFTNQIWKYDKRSRLWMLNDTGQLIRSKLGWDKLMGKARWNDEGKQAE